ncbi:MAG: hypothetical protein WDO69_15665 [Pseudomonadota bacterium]
MIVARNSQPGHRLANAATVCLLCLACGSQTPSGTGSAGSAGSIGGTGAGGAGAGPGGAPSGGGGSGAPAGSGAGGTLAGGAAGSDASSGSAGAGTAGASSGGTNGSAGSAGAGGAAEGPVTPTLSGTNTYRFTFGDTILEVDTQTGARVSKLSLSGADMIVTKASDPTTWGSVFWTSPRLGTWMPEWPPPVNIDNGPYTPTISGTHLLTTGTADTALGVAMAKDYAADAASGWITINYTINANKAQKAAPWEVSRVPRGGITFFPYDSSVTPGPLTVTKSAGIVWFDDSSKTAKDPGDGSKLVADGMGGWEAYALGGNLFLKRFADQPASAQVPNEGEICVYPGATWIEFEVQGPYTQIPAGGSLPWKMQWRLVKIPAAVTVAVGSATLLAFAQQQVAL